MSYQNTAIWNIIPENNPKIIRGCSKCGCKSEYISTENFRVNANGKCVDVWLIYQCIKCKTTFNLSIYKGIRPKQIGTEIFDKFLNNDKALAMQYSFNSEILQQNKAIIDHETINYHIIQEIKENESSPCQFTIIRIQNVYNIRIRIHKLLSRQLQKSRKEINDLIAANLIYGNKGENLEKAFASDGIEIILKCYNPSPILDI